MIELLLQAERTLAMGLLDQAERLYRRAIEADPRNAIAIVGLARVAVERGDDGEAHRQATRALRIDPENAAASRMIARLEEVAAAGGAPIPGGEEPVSGAAEPGAAAEPGGEEPVSGAAEPGAAAEPGGDPAAGDRS
jgi:tetratricopeptide (TPR) repeat protein